MMMKIALFFSKSCVGTLFLVLFSQIHLDTRSQYCLHICFVSRKKKHIEGHGQYLNTSKNQTYTYMNTHIIHIQGYKQMYTYKYVPIHIHKYISIPAYVNASCMYTSIHV